MIKKNNITYLNSYNSGDLITMLPGIKKQYDKTGRKAIIYQRLDLPANYGHTDYHPVMSDNVQVCVNKSMFLKLKPLLESQNYIESYNIFNGEKVDVNFDFTRHDARIPMPGGSIHHWPFLTFPQLDCNLNNKWIEVEHNNNYQNTIIINRTHRYNNPYIDYFFLKKYENNILFAGTAEEHIRFKNSFNIDIKLLEVANFLELAIAINSCKLFIGNQSFCWHLADSMKTNRILEVCTAYPNTFPTGDNGHCFTSQEALEFYFKELSKNIF